MKTFALLSVAVALLTSCAHPQAQRSRCYWEWRAFVTKMQGIDI